jgi:F0F1-type ATP synthase assembly protein I
MPEEPSGRRQFGRYLILAQAGLDLVAPLVVGILADLYFGIMPWLTITGAVLGFAGGLTHLIILANRIQREDERERSRRGPP